MDHASARVRGLLPEQCGVAPDGPTAGLVIGDGPLSEEIRSCLEELQVRIVLEYLAPDRIYELVERLRAIQPDFLFIDLPANRERLEETLRAVRSASPYCLVIAVHERADSELILEALRAGAGEYLYPPVEPGFRKALDRWRARQKGSRRAGKVLGVLSAKGGCGATTIACHLAAGIGRVAGKSVLLTDLDLESGIAGFLMGAKTEYSIADVVRNLHRLDTSYWKAVVAPCSDIDVIPAPIPPAPEDLAPSQIRGIVPFLRSVYEWVIADLGRGPNPVVASMAPELDELLLVAALDKPALFSAKSTAELLIDSGFNRERLRLVLNRVPRNAQTALAEIEKYVGLPVYAEITGGYPQVSESYLEGKLLPVNSELGRQFTQLVRTILGLPLEQFPAGKSGLFGWNPRRSVGRGLEILWGQAAKLPGT